MSENNKLSIIVPLLNEEENVALLYRGLKSVLDNLAVAYEIIFIDDGSTDGTYRLLRGLKSSDKNIIIIKFTRNFGQSAALSAGFNIATGDLAITLDGDIQCDPADIVRLLDAIKQGADVVCGWRQAKCTTFLIKRYPSIIAHYIGSIFFGLQVHDFSCSFSMYKKDCYKKLFLREGLHRFIPVIAKFDGMVIREVKVPYSPRKRGSSKYSFLRFPKVIKDALLLKIAELFLFKSYKNLFKEADYIIETIIY